jgi:hypothetical protein
MTDLSRKAAWRGLGIALLLLAGATGSAVADVQQEQKDGFLCSVQLLPAASPLGHYGSIKIKLTEEPHCGGAVTASVVACSLGGQASRLCDPTQEAGVYLYLHDEPQLVALYESLVIAAAGQFQISVIVGDDRLRWVNFFAAGYLFQN